MQVKDSGIRTFTGTPYTGTKISLLPWCRCRSAGAQTSDIRENTHWECLKARRRSAARQCLSLAMPGLWRRAPRPGRYLGLPLLEALLAFSLGRMCRLVQASVPLTAALTGGAQTCTSAPDLPCEGELLASSTPR